MKQSIERKTELYLCQKLREAISDLLFVPESGGDEQTGQQFDIEPQYAVVLVKSAEKTVSYLPVYHITGAVRAVFQNTEVKSGDQSRMRRRIWEALDAIGEDRSDIDTFTFSGLDVSGIASETDDKKKARIGDIEFTAGVSD